MEERTTTIETGLVLNYQEMPAYKGAKERQLELLDKYPFVAINDSRSYELAKQHRTALRQGRYDLQNGEKTIASKLNDFRQMVKIETENLINITLSAETKQQSEIDRFEAEKQREKDEALRKERERKEALRNMIFSFRDIKNAALSAATIKTIEAIIIDIESAEMQVEEFAEDFSQVKAKLIEDAKRKQSQLIEDERLKAERKAQEEERQRLADERAALEKQKKDQEEELRKINEERDTAEAKLKAERDELEAEKARIAKEEEDRKAKEEEDRKAKEEAEQKAAEEAKQNAEREKQEAEAKAKRDAEIEALRPDKEKLQRMIENFNPSEMGQVELSSPIAKILLGEFINELNRAKSVMIQSINEL